MIQAFGFNLEGSDEDQIAKSWRATITNSGSFRETPDSSWIVQQGVLKRDWERSFPPLP
jgi:hypothetical protein